MGDKPLQSQDVINFLNSRTKTQLQFEGIQDRIDLIAQAKKYIPKDKMLQDATAKAKYMLSKVDDFKSIFKDVFEHGLPNFWDVHGVFLSENDYQEEFQERRNDVSSFNQHSTVIKGQDILNVLEKDFKLLYIMKETILSLPTITYFFYSYLGVDSRETLTISFPSNSVWQRICTFSATWIESKEASYYSMSLT